MPSLLLFARVWLQRTLFLSTSKTFISVPLLPVVNLCPHFLFIDNSFDFCFGPSKTFANSFNSFGILSWRNYPYWNICSLTTPSFRVDLSRMVCRSACLNVEKMAPFVNIFDVCFPFTIFSINIVERRLSLYYVSAVLPNARDWALIRNTRVNL